MNRAIELTFSLLASALAIFSVQYLGGCSNDVKRIDKGLDLEKMGSMFHVVFDRGTEYELRYSDVDSIAIAAGAQAALIHGQDRSSGSRQWFFVGGGQRELRKSFGPWQTAEFHKYRLDEIDKDRSMFRRLVSTQVMWNQP